MKSDKARMPLTRLWGTTNESIIELKVCVFIAEHDLSLSLSYWMVPLLHSLFPKDTSMAKIRLEKQKATNIIWHAYAFRHLEHVVITLRKKI